MSDLLDLPPIVMPAEAKTDLAPLDLKKIDLTDVALAQYGDWRKEVAATRANLSTLVLDLTTPTKIKDARALRQRLIGDPLAAVRKVSAGIKSKMAQASKAVGAELEKIEAAYTKADALILPQIEAREAVLEAERAEKARLEAERVAKLQAGIATIRGYVQRAAGLPSERIAKGIAGLAAMTFPVEEWAEFAVPAANAQCETLEALRRMHVAAVQAEADKAARERLEADAAERAAQERAAAPVEPPAPEPAQQPDPALYRPLQDAPVAVQACRTEDRAMLATPAGAELVKAAATALAAEPATEAPPASVHVDTSEQPTIKLGDLNARLGFTMTEAFVRDVLKVKPADSKGRAVLIPEASLPDLADALVKQIREVLG
jgi:hypothetical protein